MTTLTRRRFIAGSLASAAIIRSAGIRSARAQQQIVLEFPSWQAEEPGLSTWWREVIARFEQQNAGVRVNLFQIPFAQFVNQMTTRFAAGTPPEIVHLPARNFASFAAQDWLAPLDDRLRTTDIAQNWTSLQEEMTWDGKAQGLLLMGYGSILFYNERLLREGDVGLPTTADQFLAAIERLTRRDQGIFGFAATTIEHPQILVDVGTWVTGAGLDWTAGGRYRFTEPQIVAAFDQYRRALRFAPPGQSAEASRQLFIDGKIAFVRDGPWVWAATQQAPEAVRPHLKIARLPFQYVSGGTSHSLHMPASLTGRKAELVWEFMKLVMTPAMQERFTVLSGSPSPRRGALSTAEQERLPHLRLINAAAAEARNLFPTLPTLRENYNEFARAIAQASMRLQSSDVATAAGLADLQRALERQLPIR